MRPKSILKELTVCEKPKPQQRHDLGREYVPQGWKLSEHRVPASLLLSLSREPFLPSQVQVRSCPRGAGSWGLAAGRVHTGGEWREVTLEREATIRSRRPHTPHEGGKQWCLTEEQAHAMLPTRLRCEWEGRDGAVSRGGHREEGKSQREGEIQGRKAERPGEERLPVGKVWESGNEV